MIILFCGSRSFILSEKIIKIIDKELAKLDPKNDLIVHGGAIGIDSIVDDMARQKGFAVKVYKPDYKKYNSKSAPIIRDKELVDMADKIVVIWDGKSLGTSFTSYYAKIQAIKTRKKYVEEYSFSPTVLSEFNR